MSPTKAKARTNGAGNREQRRYTRKRVVLLQFEDPEFEGLEVRCRRVSIDTALDLGEMAEALDVTEADREQLREFFGRLVGVGPDGPTERVLLSWNLDEETLDDDGNETGEVVPVPLTVDGLMSQDQPFVMAIFNAWMASVIGVSGPLGATSPGGQPSAGLSLPMEPLSPSPES